MARRKWRKRRLWCEQLESRRLLAGTAPDMLELVSTDDRYQSSSPVWQRSFNSPPVITDSTGSLAYDLRTNLPGDQTLWLANDTSNSSGTRINRLADSMTRVLVDPRALYELRFYWTDESTSVAIDLYDAAGQSLGRRMMSVSNEQVDSVDNLDLPGWHRAFIGMPVGQPSVPFMQLPSATYAIEVRAQLTTTFGFAGDSLESGPQVVQWNAERSAVSAKTLDLVEGDDAILIQPDKVYELDASVRYLGSAADNMHSIGYTAYDRDGSRIESKHVERYGTATDTRLTRALNPGDTFIDLDDASGWSLDAGPETRSLAWYGYQSASGQVYEDYTYTRNVASDAVIGLWPQGGITGNRITLNAPWSGPALRAGTAVRNAVDNPSSNLFRVLASHRTAPIQTTATVSGFWKNGVPQANAFPAGAASFKPAAVLNEVLQVSGVSELRYSVSTTSSAPVAVDTNARTRSVLIDVMANDSLALEASTTLVGASSPKYGSVQIVAGATAGRPQIRYTTAAYFVGTDRFTYTLRSGDGRLVNESVTVSSLGGNLDANPTLQQAVSQNSLTAQSVALDYGDASYRVASGATLTTRADNLNALSQLRRETLQALTYSLVKGTQHGTLSISADGSIVYQSDPGFVGNDTFEYIASNGLQTSTRLGTFSVAASVDEVDRDKAIKIARAINNYESTYKRLFYTNVPSLFDANGVPFVSWRVHMLPFLGFSELYNKFRLTEPWNSANNLPLLSQMPDIYRSAGDDTLSSSTRFLTIQAGSADSPTTHFMKSNGAPNVTLLRLLGHNLGSILMVLRAGTDRAVPWTKPDDLAFDNANPLATLGNSPESVIPVSFADGTGALMPKDVLASTFASIATVSDSGGIQGVDGPTLQRAWSQQFVAPQTHTKNYYAKQNQNLRDIGLGVLNYESAFKLLPAWGSTDASGNRLLSWRVLILPYLGYQELYSRFQLNEPWNSPTNLSLLDSMPDVFRSATDSPSTTTTRMRLLNGPGTLYDSALTKPLRLSQIVDGTSNTMFAVLAGTDKAVPWTMPETLPLGDDFMRSIGLLPDGQLSGVAVDGAAWQLPASGPGSLSNATLKGMATYNGGEPEGTLWTLGSNRIRNSLRWISLALLNFESTYRRLPINLWGDQGFVKKSAAPTLSWRVAILPFIEEVALYNKFHFDEPWDSPHNLSLLPLMPEVFRSHGMNPESALTRMQMFNGSRTILRPDGVAVRLADITDGTSNTLAVVEAGIDKAVPWTKPSDLDGEAVDLWQALGLVDRAFSAVLVDTGVVTVRKVDSPYLNGLVLRNDGGAPPVIDPTQRIVIREGQLAAIDLPNTTYSLEATSSVVAASEHWWSPNGTLPTAIRVTLQALDNNQIDGTRIVRLTTSGRVIEIIVLDDEQLSISVTPGSISEVGGAATLTVTRKPIDVGSALFVQLKSSAPSRLSMPASVMIPAGQLSVNVPVTAIDNVNPGDTTSVRISASAAGWATQSTTLQITDFETLQLAFSALNIQESSGVTVGTVKRLGGLGTQLIVRLEHDQTGKVNIPEFVILPAGQTSATFEARAVDDAAYDGSFAVHVVANATDYETAAATFGVIDDEPIGLTLSQTVVSEENQQVTLTVTRAANSLGQPLLVTLQSDRPDKLRFADRVLVPANQMSISVPVRTVDNSTLDGSTAVTISALYGESSQQYVAGTVGLSVTDHETLSLSLEAPVLIENRLGLARVTRNNTDIDTPLTVEFTSSPPDLLIHPASITILPGQQYVEFHVVVIGDNRITGDRTVALEVHHQAYVSQTLPIVISDYEPLSLSFSALEAREGTTVEGIVSRNNTELDREVHVQLRSSDTTEIEVPSLVVIPAGQSSARFTARLPYDRIADGSEFIRVTAESAGFIAATDGVIVQDTEMFAIELLESDLINESAGTVMARVMRSGIVTSQPLKLLVTSSDSTIAYVSPTLIQAPANQAFFEFPIVIVDDRIFESTQSVRLTFTPQDSYAEPVEFDFNVEDDESTWHNPAQPLDVNGDSRVTPLDALLVINYLNRYSGQSLGTLPRPEPGEALYVDTSRDQNLSAIDALLVINYINTFPSGEGETAQTSSGFDGDWDVLKKRARAR